MTWQTPKTDWQARYDSEGRYAGDYFNASDYVRIKNNLTVLKTKVEDLYAKKVALPDIPTATTESYYTEREINALERGVDSIRESSFDPGLPATKIWYGNSTAPLAEDYNRIESCCLRLNNMLEGQSAARRKLAFTLGGVVF